MAQKFYADFEENGYDALLAALSDANREIKTAVAARSNAALYEAHWYGKWTMGRMIQLNIVLPYANAWGRIRRVLKVL